MELYGFKGVVISLSLTYWLCSIIILLYYKKGYGEYDVETWKGLQIQ